MNIFQAFILGIVQGIAEFLPISSSGHLVVFQTLLGLEEPSFFFDVLLHVATLVPILIVFREDILSLIKNPFQKTTYLLIVATIPTVVFVALFGDATDALFASGTLLPFCFILTGLMLIFADKMSERPYKKEEVGYFDAIVIGCMQILGALPGVSRSGSTLTGALSTGVKKDEGARFVFLMAIPAILGALVLQLKDIFTGEVVIANESIVPIIIGCLAAAISGYLSINFLLALIKKSKLQYFAYYVFALAAIVFISQTFFDVQFLIAR